MANIPLEHGLLLAGTLFTIGVIGLIIRRNIFFILLSIEIMLNASGLAFIVAGYHHGQPDGQIMFLFILTVAAAEVAVGLAIVLQLFQRFRTLDVDAASLLKG